MVSFALRNKPWKEENLKFPWHAKSAIAAIFEFSVSSQFPQNCARSTHMWKRNSHVLKMIYWSTRNAMREQKQKIKISLLDLRKFVGVDRFRLIDTVFGNKNTYPWLNYFSSEPVECVQMVGRIVFPSSLFRPHTTTWTPGNGHFSAFLYYKTTRLLSPVNRLSVWGKSETLFSLFLSSPRSRFFHPFPKQRACSQAKTFAPGNSQANLVSSPSVVFKVIKGVYICGTDYFFLY